MVFQKGHKGYKKGSKKVVEQESTTVVDAEVITIKSEPVFTVDLEKEKEMRQKKFMDEHPNFNNKRKHISLPDVVVTPVNAAEVLVGAINNVIGLYNKISESIDDVDIKKMPLKDKINALQKLSYIHTATKKFQPKMQFIKIDTTKASATDLESALLDFNKMDNNTDEL